MSMDEQDKRAWLRGWGLFGVTVVDLLGPSGAMLGIGWLLWKKLGWPGWIVPVLCVVGFSAGVYRIQQRTSRELDKP